MREETHMAQWENDAEKLYLAQAEGMFRLAFVHSCQMAETELLIREVLAELLTAKKAMETARHGETGMLRLMHKACMRYYEKKLRKKIKLENLKKQTLPFPICDGLVQILHLPYGLKSPLVLRLGLHLSPEAAGKVLGYGPKRVEKKLKKAQKRLSMPAGEVQALLQAVRIPESDRQHLFDRVQTDAAEQSFRGNERLRRFTRRMDRAAPAAAALVLLLLLSGYLAVRFHWFGTEELSAETRQWLAEESTGAEKPARETATVRLYVPAGDSLNCYRVADCPTDIEKLVPLMVSLGGMPEGSRLVTASLTYAGEFPPFAAPATTRGGKTVLTVTLSEEAAVGITPEMLEAMARTFQDFTGDEHAEIHIYAGKAELTAGGKTGQALLEQNTAVGETAEIHYREQTG